MGGRVPGLWKEGRRWPANDKLSFQQHVSTRGLHHSQEHRKKRILLSSVKKSIAKFQNGHPEGRPCNVRWDRGKDLAHLPLPLLRACQEAEKRGGGETDRPLFDGLNIFFTARPLQKEKKPEEVLREDSRPISMLRFASPPHLFFFSCGNNGVLAPQKAQIKHYRGGCVLMAEPPLRGMRF